MLARAIACIVSALALASGAAAELYRWTDANGTIHFTENLSRVPAEHRDAVARSGSTDIPDRVQTYSSGLPPSDAAPATRTGEAIRIPFERRGSLMWVHATVNDRKRVPFLIDTGASGVSLPAQVVADLGIPIHSGTPRVTVSTANGLVRVPMIDVGSVQLGEARVENLRATVNPTMDVGLLGGSFFNNFHYSVDAAAGVITLAPNDAVRGGAAADQWRDRFRSLRGSIDRLESYLGTRQVTRDRQRHELEATLASLKDDLQSLEIEANHARVPQGWRH
jgi:clan AA aspartic protease (TIGR02281 family)